MDSSEMRHETDEEDEVGEKDLLNNIVSALTGGRDMKGGSSKSKKLKKNFCVTDTLTAADIKVLVKGIGKVSFPLNKAYVEKLINVSTTAKFGMGEKTVVDKNVRNTQMIPSKSLDVTINQESLLRITSKMQKSLNLPANSTLTPHLHNMLIYGPGQFFNKHRDSEKLPNMVATLVIILPSPHIGGDLIVEHVNKKHIFSTENVDEENAKCICFYSDCVHEVKKIKCGYRVALTFNVVLETEELADIACANVLLKVAVQNYFNTVYVNDRVKKVIFFLNHTYSKHSLRWNLLKGEDCQYASNFRSVARELNLDTHLVLAKIHQNWVLDDGYEEPNELIETDSTLNYWVDADNMQLPYGKYSTDRDEICFAQETHYENFDPIKEEFVPTGNEGTNVDYWYRRAAIVLWLKSDSMIIKFELNFDAAMTELLTLISVPGNEEKVAEIMGKVVKLSNTDRPKKDDFETFANIALYVKEKKDAQAILSPFCLNILITENVEMLIRLQQQYDIQWLTELVDAWQQEKSFHSYPSDSLMTPKVNNTFVLEFLKSEGDRSIIEYLLNAEVTTFIDKSTKWSTFFHFGQANHVERLRELFMACITIENAALQGKLAQFLTSQSKLFPKNDLVKLYHELQNTLSPECSELLRAHLEESLKEQLSLQTRDVDDWSLSEVLSCSCEHCNVLTNFMNSRTDKSKSWPAKGNICKHIMSILERSKVPINVTVDRTKRPFTMLLIKRPTLHAEATEKCVELKAMLQILEPKIVQKRQSSVNHDDEKRQKL